MLQVVHVDPDACCVFRTHHASNHLSLRGEGKANLLESLDNALVSGRDAIRPEAWRGL